MANDETKISERGTPGAHIPEKSGRTLWKRFGKQPIRWLWSAIPFLFLVALLWGAGVLFSKIQAKNELLKAKKMGLHILEGMELAGDQFDAVVEVIHGAKDGRAAHDGLIKHLDLTPRQARAITQMPLEQLTGSRRDQVKRQVQTLRREIAENRFQPQQKKPVVNVVALEMAPTLLRDKISFPGFVEPWIRLEVFSEVKGMILRLEIDEGDPVQRGDIIAVLDSRDFENSYRSARASYEAALATQKRLNELYKKNLATRNDLDDAIARAEQYKATMDNLLLSIERCTIRSPLSGVANRLFVEKGQYLRAEAKVAEILNIDKVKVRVGIPESDVDAVRRLDAFTVKIDALGGKTFRAGKRFLSKTAHSTARLYALELELANPGRGILPDMFARVEIVKRELSDGLVVPLYSVISRNDEHIVYVLDDAHARSRKIELGFQEGWMIAVAKGLSPGEQVIVMGHRSVSDGQEVNPVRIVADIRDLEQ